MRELFEDGPVPSGIQALIDDLATERDPGRRDHLRARFDLALAAHRADQEWAIFRAQSERAAREAQDAMDRASREARDADRRHHEAQATAKANAMAADAQATAANGHAAALKIATRWLSVSTAVLAVATVVLVIVTATKG